MRGRKTKRNILIISLVAVLFLMGIGYAAFQTNLTIKGTGTVAGKWDIKITDITDGEATGKAENVSLPSYDALTANMEANLYEKGDSMVYEVTIENTGTMDAALDNIQKSEITNEAIKISVTGYTKGQILKSKSSMIVKVKIEYDESYSGQAEEGSGNVQVVFNFAEAGTTTNQGGEVVTTGKYKVSFDCKTNGSSSCANNDEYYAEGAEIDLTSKLPTEPKGYTFKGWGLTSDATEYITEYTVTDEDVTIYAIYEGKEGPSITNIATTSTTNSINVVVTATDSNSTIETYEYSKDGGDSWVTSDNSTYTFNNLKQNTEYEIYVRVTNGDEGTTYSDKTKVKTKTIDAPTFAVKSISGSDKTIEIIYPEVTKDDGTKLTCQSGLTCSYGKNGLDFETVTNTTETLSFNDVGTIIAKVSDGTNEVSNSYTINTTGKLADYSTLSSTTLYTTYKTNITSIDIVDYNTIPEEAVESWNVSDANSAGTVNAWIIEDSETSGKYKLYIGSPQGVIANEDSSGLFNGFTSVTNINLTSLFTNDVTDMGNMFKNCTNLTSLDLSNFDTSKVTNMYGMFSGMASLTILNISNFDTSSVTDMSYMFSGMASLINLDISAFNTTSVTDMSYMFSGMASLTAIYVSDDFVTTGVATSTDMFSNDTNLVGGNGTVYDSSKVDKEYARVDTSEILGYFTDGSIPIIDSVNTTSTTNSITLVTAVRTFGKYYISKIEYSKDGGETYSEGAINGNTPYSLIYTFTGLEHSKRYQLKVRITSNSGQTVEKSIGFSTVSEQILSTTPVVTEGDGLYKDEYEEGRYIYKGANPDNYINFNNETWRIYSVENDGSIKIIRNETLKNIVGNDSNLIFDLGYKSNTTYGKTSSTNKGTRYSENSKDYCVNDYSYTSGYGGCNAWGSKTTTLDINGNHITSKSKTAGETATTYTLPESESYINVYLNHQFNDAITYKGWVSGTTYENFTLPSYYTLDNNSVPYIKTAIWNIGAAAAGQTSTNNLATMIKNEKLYKWSGKVGLLTASEYMRANTNIESCATFQDLYNNARNTTCKSNNYLYLTQNWWLISPWAGSYRENWVSSSGTICDNDYAEGGNNEKTRPVLFLDSAMSLDGEGTSDDKYVIEEQGIKTAVIESPTYKKEDTDDGVDLTVTFNNDCSKFKCEYSTDNGNTWTESSTDTKMITLTENKTYHLIGKITDKEETSNFKTSTYTVALNDLTATELKTLAVNEGDGLYANISETNRYVFRGSNPDNYICMGDLVDGECPENLVYRVISIESDNTIKVIKNTKLADMIWDKGYQATPNRYQGTSSDTTNYCISTTTASTGYYACKAWGSKTTTYNSGLTKVTTMPREYGGTKYTLPTNDSWMSVFLNGGNYGGSNTTGWYTYSSGIPARVKSQISTDHVFLIGVAPYNQESNTLNQDRNNEATYKWKGTVGLITFTDYIATSNSEECSNYYTRQNCWKDNWLNNGTSYWTMSPMSYSGSGGVINIKSDGTFNWNSGYVDYGNGPRPVMFLKSNTILRGAGTLEDPYRVV